MNYAIVSVGDTVLYQGTNCAYPVTQGNTYEVKNIIPTKPRHFIYTDDAGNDHIAMLNYSWVKVKGS